MGQKQLKVMGQQKLLTKTQLLISRQEPEPGQVLVFCLAKAWPSLRPQTLHGTRRGFGVRFLDLKTRMEAKAALPAQSLAFCKPCPASHTTVLELF